MLKHMICLERESGCNIERNQVNVRNLSAGAYLLNIETEGRNFTEKFIKNNY